MVCKWCLKIMDNSLHAWYQGSESESMGDVSGEEKESQSASTGFGDEMRFSEVNDTGFGPLRMTLAVTIPRL